MRSTTTFRAYLQILVLLSLAVLSRKSSAMAITRMNMRPTTPLMIRQRYIITGTLGAGSYGKVFRAIDRRNGQQVAIKQSASGEYDKKIARGEAEMIQQVICEDPNGVIEMRDHFDCGQQQYCIVLELMSCDLIKVAHRIDGYNVPLRLNQVQQIARDVLPALARFAQQQIVHGDIKLENILYNERSGHYKLADFGISFGPESDALIAELRQFHGTLQYMSPEVFVEGKMTPATDMWSLGVTLANTYLNIMIFDFHDHNLKTWLAQIWERRLGRMPGSLRKQLTTEGFKVTPVYTRIKPDLKQLLYEDGDSAIRGLHDFVDFLSRCFDYNPQTRMTAEEALKHPFLVNEIHVATENKEKSMSFG